MKKTHQINALLILYIFLTFNSVIGAEKSIYFEKIVNSWGLKVYTAILSQENKYIVPDPKKDRYFLLTTSQMIKTNLDLQDLQIYQNVIIVCDTYSKLNEDISCDFNAIATTHNVYNADNVAILNIKIDNTVFIVLPEAHLIIPENVKQTSKYFEALSKAIPKVESMSETSENKHDVLIADDWLKESMSIAIWVIACYFTFTFIIFLSRQTQKDRLISLIRKLLIFCKTWWPRILIANILISMILFVGLLADVGIPGLIKDIRLLLENQNITEIRHLAILKSIYLYMGFFVNILTVVALYPSFYPTIYKSTNGYKSSLIKKTDEPKTSKIATYSIIFLSIFGSILAFLKDHYENRVFLILTILVCLYLQSHLRNMLFRLKEKIIILIFVSSLLGYILISENSKTYISQNEPMSIFSVASEIVILPYNQTYTKKMVYKEFTFTPEFPIFLDKYLVFHPEFNVINNINIELFNADGNYMIVTKNSKEYLALLLTYPNLRTHGLSKDQTHFFYFDKIVMQGDKVKLNLNVNCDKDIEETELIIKKHKPNLPPENYTYLNFPGCSATDKEITYEVPIDSSLFQTSGIFELLNLEKINLLDLNLYVNNQKIDLKYITVPENYNAITVKNIFESKEINVYAYKTESEISFVKKKNELNLTEVLSKILNSKENIYVQQVWSNVNHAVIKVNNQNY